MNIESVYAFIAGSALILFPNQMRVFRIDQTGPSSNGFSKLAQQIIGVFFILVGILLLFL